jgi:polar amino acid transport system substrate-binding protein
MQAVYRDLAPGGTLRAAVSYSNPVLVQRDAAGGEPCGLAIDMVDELARRLSVPRSLLGFEGAASLVDAGLAGAWDVGFVAIHPVRAQGLDFTPPFVVLEGTYVVHEPSPYHTALDLDHAGMRIAVVQGTVYDVHLTRSLRHAQLVRSPTPDGARECFLADGLDAVAGLKQPLAAFAHATPGLRVIEGRFAAIEQAIAVPKGRYAGLRYLKAFVEETKASGRVAAALEHAAPSA